MTLTIVFSAILNTESTIGDLIINSEDLFEFSTATYLREEIENHQEKLLEISGLSIEQFQEAKFQIFSHLIFISEEQIPFEVWHKAVQFVRNVDMDDIAFVALSEFEKVKLWTGDKKLREGLIAKGFQRCISTQELFDLRDKMEQK